MAGVTELVFAEQFGHLAEVAGNRGWALRRMEGPGFALVLPARDRSRFGLSVLCDEYPSRPPAWQWAHPETGVCGEPADTPRGAGYFHGSGRICAPWNRLAYRQVDPQGPHSDWQISNWLTNPRTGGCTTLVAMALRLAVELKSGRYQGRAG